MKLTVRLLLPLLLVISILSPAAARAASPAGRAEQAIVRAVARDLCGKQVVLLGENGFHGDGRTIAFKAALVERLVARCGFKAVYFEASHYDFLEVSRRLRAGEPATREMIASAIGGIWNQDEEIQPLIGFLQARAAAGRLQLGGLDDQVGSRGAFYSLEAMPADLAGILRGTRQNDCRRLLRQRIWSAYPRDAPYSEAVRAQVQQCLSEIRAAIASGVGDPARREDRLQMIDNFERCIGRDFIAGLPRAWDRDRSMFLNLQWLLARLPPDSKVIVWAANIHVAKDGAASPLFAGKTLGGYVHEAYGPRAFALAFSAASGSFRYNVRTPRDIAPAPPGSLEALALGAGKADLAYLRPARLARLGPVSGGAFDDHEQRVTRWGDVYDGVVVFRSERPPRRRDE